MKKETYPQTWTCKTCCKGLSRGITNAGKRPGHRYRSCLYQKAKYQIIGTWKAIQRREVLGHFTN